MRVDPTAGTGGEVMSDAGTIIGVHFPGRRLRLFTFCDDQRSECLAGRRKTPAWARFFAALRSRSHSAMRRRTDVDTMLAQHACKACKLWLGVLEI